MNASELWSGQEYAWAEYRPRGRFPMNAIKVKVSKVYKQRQAHNNNASTYADVEVLEGRREGQKIQVRARDIVDFWDEYSQEKEHREETLRKEREIAEKLREQQRVEREARLAREAEEAEERRQRREAQSKLIAIKLQEKGIPEDCIYSIGEHSISLKTSEVRIWLEIPTV